MVLELHGVGYPNLDRISDKPKPNNSSKFVWASNSITEGFANKPTTVRKARHLGLKRAAHAMRDV